ncbi:MAG: glycosyltransferase [Candidatus Hodarchaeota archaeon]
MSKKPIIMISSYPPRLCGIATFAEEAREFIQKANPDKDVLVISHYDGEGEGIFPIINTSSAKWWKIVADKIKELDPYAVHLEHEYGLYEYYDARGISDKNEGFLILLEAISEYPLIVEPHTIHGRISDYEANFIYQLCQNSDVVLFKCHYQKWRLDWSFRARGWEPPQNIMVIPHGARPDKRWGVQEIPNLKKELGLNGSNRYDHLIGMVGWIQTNKRWDILLSIWEEIYEDIKKKSDQEWQLFAAGTMRDPNHKKDYEMWKSQILELQDKGLAYYYEFIPRGDLYYKVMAICDFIVLPTIDETQSGTLARIISLNKPYITSAPMEGLTAQTLENEGGLLFTTKKMLKDKVVQLACDENLRLKLGENLKKYLDNTVSWEIVAQQYNYAYELARKAKRTGKPVMLEKEF